MNFYFLLCFNSVGLFSTFLPKFFETLFIEQSNNDNNSNNDRTVLFLSWKQRHAHCTRAFWPCSFEKDIDKTITALLGRKIWNARTYLKYGRIVMGSTHWACCFSLRIYCYRTGAGRVQGLLLPVFATTSCRCCTSAGGTAAGMFCVATCQVPGVPGRVNIL